MVKGKGLLTRFFEALLGKTKPPVHETAGANEAAVAARIAGLELELSERDKKISAMKEEYIREQKARQAAYSEGGAHQLENLFSRIAPDLANAVMLAAYCKAGHHVTAQDLSTAITDIARGLQKAGMEPTGQPLAEIPFDPSVHEPLGSERLQPGEVVTIEAPGYRYGNRLLTKSLVKRKRS